MALLFLVVVALALRALQAILRGNYKDNIDQANPPEDASNEHTEPKPGS